MKNEQKQSYKERALSHVKTLCPELMELSKGCDVYSNLNPDKGIFVGGVVWLNETEGTLEDWHDDMKIIGHTPHLEHWLRTLGMRVGRLCAMKDGEIAIEMISVKDIVFNLTTGQPATEEDYKAYCEIVGA